MWRSILTLIESPAPRRHRLAVLRRLSLKRARLPGRSPSLRFHPQWESVSEGTMAASAQKLPSRPLTSVFSAASPSPRQSRHTFRLRRAGLILQTMIRTSTWSSVGTGRGICIRAKGALWLSRTRARIDFFIASVTGSTVFWYQTPSCYGDTHCPSRPSLRLPPEGTACDSHPGGLLLGFIPRFSRTLPERAASSSPWHLC